MLPVPKTSMLLVLPNFFFPMSLNTSVSTIPLSLTEVHSSPLHLLGNLHDYFTMMFAFQPPTTLKQMGKPNEPTKKLRPISKSSAPITPRNGQNSLLQPNSTTTPLLTVPQKSPPFLSWWDPNPVPTLHSEKHSSQPWKIVSLP